MNLNEEMLSAWNEPDGVQACIEVAENYAKSYYNQKIEEAGKELPDDETLKAMCCTDVTAEGIVSAKWMRSEASKIIAKEIEGKANTTNLLMRKISQANDLVLDHEKEIEDLKSQLSKLKAEGQTVLIKRSIEKDGLPQGEGFMRLLTWDIDGGEFDIWEDFDPNNEDDKQSLTLHCTHWCNCEEITLPIQPVKDINSFRCCEECHQPSTCWQDGMCYKKESSQIKNSLQPKEGGREVEFAIKFHDWYADKLSFNNRPDGFFDSVNDGNGNASTEKAMQLFLKQKL